MAELAKLTLNVGGNDQTVELPIVEGTEHERGIDIGSLRAKTGYVCLDPAFMNTASTTSAITFLDGELGILRYRGYPIEQLGKSSSFVEVAYLVINGKLPTQTELDAFSLRSLDSHESCKTIVEVDGCVL